MLELRPKWCAKDEVIRELLSFGDWLDDAGNEISIRTGDEWKPGASLKLRRTFTPAFSEMEIRQKLNLPPEAFLGVAARWSCKDTALAGSHNGGPLPLSLEASTDLELEIPGDLGGSVEVETCLIVRMDSGAHDATAAPDGALIWSDSWSTSQSERRVLLEGSELRIPVLTVSFKSYFDTKSRALWSIEAEPAGLEDMITAVVTVLLNDDVMPRIQGGPEDEGAPNVNSLSSTVAAGVQVDLVRVLTGLLIDEIEEVVVWSELPEASVGRWLLLVFTQAFGSTRAGVQYFREDQSAFARCLWSLFAPERWDSA